MKKVKVISIEDEKETHCLSDFDQYSICMLYEF